MQTEASSKLGLNPTETMSLAQELFEGPNVTGITHGLITYLEQIKQNIAKNSVKKQKRLLLINSWRPRFPR